MKSSCTSTPGYKAAKRLLLALALFITAFAAKAAAPDNLYFLYGNGDIAYLGNAFTKVSDNVFEGYTTTPYTEYSPADDWRNIMRVCTLNADKTAITTWYNFDDKKGSDNIQYNVTYTLSSSNGQWNDTSLKIPYESSIKVVVDFSGTKPTLVITEHVNYTPYYTLDGTNYQSLTGEIMFDAVDGAGQFKIKVSSKNGDKFFGPSSTTEYNTNGDYALAENDNSLTLPEGSSTYKLVVDDFTAPTKVNITRSDIVIYPKTKYISVNGNKTEYTDGEYTFNAGDVITFSGKLSDNSAEPTWGLASDVTLAAGTYTLTKNATGKFTAPSDADDWIYNLTLTPDPNDDAQENWTLTITRSANTSTLSRTLTPALKNFTNVSSYRPTNDDTMWYNDQFQNHGNTTEYDLLIGNGSLGACIAGKDGTFKIALNEKGYFEGDPTSTSGKYQGLTSISVATNGVYATNENYIHQIDFTTGTLSMVSNCGSHLFAVEGIGSYPDQVLAFHFTDSGQKITLTITGGTTSVSDGIGYGTYSSSLSFTTGAVCYAVKATNGTVTSSGTAITVTEADEVCLYIAGATDLDPADTSKLKNTEGLPSLVQSRATAAANKGWSSVYASHLADYQGLYGKMSLKLEGQTNDMPTDKLQSGYDNNTLTGGQMRMYEELVFAYGRYLSISSSRPYNGSIGLDAPSNLQGIWGPSGGMWNCDIHANINVQMNYWPNDVTNLSSTHEALLNWLIAMSKTDHWKSLAATQTGVDDSGWTCKVTLNPFGGATSNFNYGSGEYSTHYYTSQAWLASHIIQHYLYTLDDSFITNALPTLWGACQFWSKWLLKVGDDTNYVYEVRNEASPEHGAVENGTAHGQQMVNYLFKYTLEIAAKKGIPTSIAKEGDLEKFQEIYSHLDNGLHTWVSGGTTYLREWKYTDSFGDTNHRHLSHLTCMYPLGQVKFEDEIFEPTINAMLQRGLKCGAIDPAVWTTAWKVALWARAASSSAYQQYAADIYKSTIGSYTKAPAGTGLYTNLAAHNKCLQMEGNFGLTAAVAEMLVQSFRGEITAAENPHGYIDLAPALPSYWPAGEVNGLKAMGNYQVDYTWSGGKIQSATITCLANNPLPFYLHYSDLTNANYHVANISNMTRGDNPTEGWDNAHVWYFTPSAQGASVTIALGAGEDVQDNDGWLVAFGSSSDTEWRANYTDKTQYTSTAKFAVSGSYTKDNDGVTIGDDAITVTCHPGYKFASVAVTSNGTVSVDGANVSGTKAFTPAATSFTLNSTAKITGVLFKLVVDPNYYTAEGATQGTFPEALEGDVEDLAENFLMQDSDDNWFANSIKLYDNIDYKLDKNVTTNAFTYQRELVGDAVANGYWQPLYLPVDVTDWSGFATKVIALTGATTTSDGEVLTYTPVTGTLQAHHLYIFMPKANIDLSLSNIVVNSLPTDAATTTVESTNYTYTLTGNYAKKTNMKSSGAYALWDGAFMQAESDEVILKPYRLYLTIASKNGNQAPKRIAIRVVDPEETGIEDLMAEPQEVDDVYYDLMGRKVLNPTTGLYIHNGKKIYIVAP